MAIGFPPEYCEDYAAHNLKTAQKIALLHLALKEKEWTITHLGTHNIIVTTSNGEENWQADINLQLTPTSISIISQSAVEENNDYGKNRKVVYALMESLNHLKEQYSEEDLVAHYNAIKHDVVEDALPQREEVIFEPETPKTTKEKIADFLAMFKPTTGYMATPIIVWLNVLIFIIMVLSGVDVFEPSIPDLVAWGANYSIGTLDGQIWRLFTCTFLHIGIFHLLMNMYALIYIGILLEPLIGTKRFTIAYLLTGIIASATSLYWHDTTVSAGASGAIFGMYGLFLALLSVNIIAKEARKPLFTSIGVFVIFNLLNGLKAGIDNAAHIGGLISGIVIGYLLIITLKKSAHKQTKIVVLISALIMTGAVVLFAYNKKPSDIGIYQKKIQEFSLLEEDALKVYSLPETATEKEYEIALADGIMNWHKCGELLEEMKDLDLPNELKKQITILKAYCDIRAATFATQGKYIKAPQPSLLLELKDLRNKTDSLLQLLNE